MPRVPTIKEVVPGAAVNIVLKVDQPTGRTIAGFIGEVLTRGNHPRGIKVRLRDGRVGRVQSMAPGLPSSSSAAADDAAFDEPAPGSAPRGSERRPLRNHEGQGGGDLPSQEIGLDAYVTYAKPRGNRKGKAVGAAAGQSSASSASVNPAGGAGPGAEVSGAGGGATDSEVVTCPVCNDFTGDEAAVNHHVASHFDI